MPDARDSGAHYHITGEGFSGENAASSHQNTSATINSNAGAPRSFTDLVDFVSGPLSPGVWQATFHLAGGLTGAIVFAHGATAAEAAPSVTTSAYVPTEFAVSTSTVKSFKFIVTPQRPYIGFLNTTNITVDFSLRLLHSSP